MEDYQREKSQGGDLERKSKSEINECGAADLDLVVRKENLESKLFLEWNEE